jgi:4-amino-4-deoxy-L-arabinose transferase-like glycosyltransferase
VNRPTPAIVSQSAVRRLPRVALILFCVAYVLPGFLGREPWKIADVGAFGAMLELVRGSAAWWQPAVLGLPVDDAGPLPYWLGAVFIQALPFLPADVASRVPFGGLLALTLSATWYATYHLARQPAALPVVFAFGGEAQPADYARALADAALLALVACLGLAQLSHETTPDLVRLAFTAFMLLGAARLAQPNAPQPWRTLLWWVLGLAGLVLSGSAHLAALLGLGWLGLIASRPAPVSAADAGADPSWGPFWLALAAWLIAIGLSLSLGWLTWPSPAVALPALPWDSWARLLLWFTWPAWPLVLWTLWRWRLQWRQPHLALPLWAALVIVLHSALAEERDRALLLALPALAALAAFALPTLRRSVSALIDWFTLLFFSFCALVIWVIWFAMMTGVPAKPAANVARLAPGFTPEFSLGLFLVGALATAAWLWLVAWRVGRHREAIWKSLVLPAAGATLCWLLLMTLWLPLLDFGRSYGPISRRIATLVPPQSCVLVDGLTQAQIAALGHHGGLKLVRTTAASGERCEGLVVSPDSQGTLDQRVDLTQWAFKATVRRLTDNKESLLLYQRVGG